MKISKLKYCLMTASFFVLTLAANAQNFPIDDGGWNNPRGPWAGDTIIFIPITPIGGGGNTAPSLHTPITVIYNNGYAIVSTSSNTTFAISILNDEHNVCLRTEIRSIHNNPTILDLTTLPSGHYTLLLYINNECLEGEFEKE